jgi:hypothetical protein
MDPVIREALLAIERRDWIAVKAVLHPYLHWTDRNGRTVRDGTTCSARSPTRHRASRRRVMRYATGRSTAGSNEGTVPQSANQTGHEVDGAGDDDNTEQVCQQSVGENGPADQRITQSGIGHLVGHADRERDIGEVAVTGQLGCCSITEVDAVHSRSKVQVCVTKGEHRIDYRP